MVVDNYDQVYGYKLPDKTVREKYKGVPDDQYDAVKKFAEQIESGQVDENLSKELLLAGHIKIE